MSYQYKFEDTGTWYTDEELTDYLRMLRGECESWSKAYKAIESDLNVAQKANEQWHKSYYDLEDRFAKLQKEMADHMVGNSHLVDWKAAYERLGKDYTTLCDQYNDCKAKNEKNYKEKRAAEVALEDMKKAHHDLLLKHSDLSTQKLNCWQDGYDQGVKDMKAIVQTSLDKVLT